MAKKKKGAKVKSKASKASKSKLKGRKVSKGSRKAAKRVAKRGMPKRAARAMKVQAAKKVTGTPNLLVTYDPNHRGLAENEVREAFRKIGQKADVVSSGVEGLFELKTANPRDAVRQLRKLCAREPALFKSTYHYTPIDVWCKSEVSEMQRHIREYEKKIGNDEKWRMSLNKRHWDKMEGTPLIIKLTEGIDRPKVDLDSPQKIVQVEIIGNRAGIALIAPEEYLNVLKMRTP